jgi:peptidoglycan/LPS O-acetylase OafA/YrhL
MLLAVGAASCFVNGALAYFGWTEGAYDISPFYAVTSICLYLVLLRTPRSGIPWLEHAIGLLATHSFGIYLSHYLVLEAVYDWLIPSATLWGPLSFVCQFACAFCGGVLLAVVCERLLVKPAQRVFDKLTVREPAQRLT